MTRGAAGCLTLGLGLVLVGGFLASLEGPGRTPGPEGSYPSSSEPGAETLVPESPEATPLQVELAAAVDAGLVKLAASGRNLQELVLGLDSLSDQPLQVLIPPGTLFKPKATATQQMVVITETSIHLWPGEHQDFVVDVACASMTKDTPDSKDTFTLATKGVSSDLRKLVGSTQFAEAAFRIQQFGIWTITNNPTRTGYVGLGVAGVGSGPSSAEIRQLKALFKAVGIDSTKYRALR